MTEIACWHCGESTTVPVTLEDDCGNRYQMCPKCADGPWPMSEVPEGGSVSVVESRIRKP